MPALVVIGDSPKGATFELPEGRIDIGRLPENSVRLGNSTVSRRHAELTLAGGVCHLRDLRSTNGTWVNSQSVVEVNLDHGDFIRFGSVTLRYQSRPMNATRRPPPSRKLSLAVTVPTIRPELVTLCQTPNPLPVYPRRTCAMGPPVRFGDICAFIKILGKAFFFILCIGNPVIFVAYLVLGAFEESSN